MNFDFPYFSLNNKKSNVYTLAASQTNTCQMALFTQPTKPLQASRTIKLKTLSRTETVSRSD